MRRHGEKSNMYNSRELAWLIRRHAIEMTHVSQGSHVGSILSLADIIGCLYSGIAKVDSKNPQWEGRDYIILSKGHAGGGIYAALAESGFFDPSILITHYANGSVLSGHVSHKGVPGVELSTGSLGHGLSVGAGIAYGLKKDKKTNRVFVILGDGECNEGSIWESAMIANSLHLDNLIAIVDRNKIQGLDFTENISSIEPFKEKWKAFGWNAQEIMGNDHEALNNAFDQALSSQNGHPSVIIADTIKGKGISFMENNVLWHYRFPHDGGEYESALAELEKNRPASICNPYRNKNQKYDGE
ncbi:MAG: transketolase [Bacilli bacterium]|nr:transketolase [Bacilli bacterium]